MDTIRIRGDLVVRGDSWAVFGLHIVGDVVAPKIESITLNTPRTRQSLVKGERLVRHGMGAVLRVAHFETLRPSLSMFDLHVNHNARIKMME